MNFLINIFEYRFVKVTLLLFLSIIIALLLINYNQYDASFDTASKMIPSNLFGYFGSYLSDLLVQYLGYASWIMVLISLSLGVSFIRGIEIGYIKFRLLVGLFSSIIFGTLIGIYFPELQVNIQTHLIGYINILPQHIKLSIVIILVFLFLICFFYSVGTRAFSCISLLFNRAKFVGRSNSKQKHGVKHVLPREFGLRNSIEINGDSDRALVKKDTRNSMENISNFECEDFELPSLDLLSNVKEKEIKLATFEELNEQAEELLKVLNEFGVKGNIIEINQGPVVTLYEFEPSPGTKSSRVIGLADDIARTLCAISARISVIPGRNVLGIELPNKQRQFFRLRELFESDSYKEQHILLPIVLGKDLAGKPCVVDLAKMPHLLVAGTTGSGKSVAINAMILSLLFKHTPKQCRFIMIDPKMLELSVYDGIPHLLSPVVTEPGKAVVALKWAVKEMENRYRLMSNLGVRNIHGYNMRISEAIKNDEQLQRTVQTGFDVDSGKPIYESVPIEMQSLPFIVVIVDEMADLMLVAGKDIESSIQRLAQMARAAGIHLIMATQRPSVDVITGVIKANFPSRVSFKVTSKIDSRTILGEQGAEQLLGMGDMLYMGNSSKIIRVHGPFVDDSEVERISKFLKTQASPEYVTSVTISEEDDRETSSSIIGSDDLSDDSLYRQALEIVKIERRASTSYIQRSLRIGYNRAALIVERMQKENVLSSPNHSGKREILIPED